MSIIKLNVTEHLLTIGNNTLITESSCNVDGVKVEFDSSWNGFVKLVVFSRKNQLEYTVLNEDDFGKIPNEILTANSEINICVIGIKDSAQITTNIIKFKIKDSLELVLEEPDEDVYRQILVQYARIQSQYLEMKNKISDVNEKYEIYQEDVQRTKNIVSTQSMQYLECIDSMVSSITGKCDLYRMNNAIMVNFKLSNVGPQLSPTTAFEYSSELPKCIKDTQVSIGTITIQISAGERKIKILSPDTSDARTTKATGEMIFLVESEENEFRFNTKIVEELPIGEQIDTNCIYFLPKDANEEFSREYEKYNKYVHINGAWESINEHDEAVLIDACKGTTGYAYFYQIANRVMIEFADYTNDKKATVILPDDVIVSRNYNITYPANISASNNNITIDKTLETANGESELVLGNKLQAVYIAKGLPRIFATNIGKKIIFEVVTIGANYYNSNFITKNIETGASFESGKVPGKVYEWEVISNGTREHYCRINDLYDTNKIVSIATDKPAAMYTDKHIINSYTASNGDNIKLTIATVEQDKKYEYKFIKADSDGNEVILQDYGENNVYKGTLEEQGITTYKSYIKDSDGNISELNMIVITVE